MKRIKQFLMGTVLAAAGFAAMPFTSYAQTPTGHPLCVGKERM